MNRVKRNFAANLAGSDWTAILGLAFTPLYLKFLVIGTSLRSGIPSSRNRQEKPTT